MTQRGAAAVQAAVGGALVAASWWSLRSPAVQRADVRAGDLLRGCGGAVPAASGDGAGRRSGLDRVVIATTDLGSLYAVAAIAGVLAVTRRPGLAADVVGVGLAGWAVSQTTKTGVNRARPYERDGTRRLLAAPAGSSFPSGHAAVATAWSTLAAARAGPRPARALLPAVGAYVAATRVHAGVHYPTDVLGGVGLGLMLSAGWRGPVATAGRAAFAGAARGGRALLGAGAGARRRLS